MRKPAHRPIAVTVALAALLTAGCSSGSKGATSPTTAPPTTAPPTTAAPTTSVAPTTTVVSTTTPTTVQPGTAVWPFASGTTRYADPVKAAKGFAVDYLGFAAPVVGEFRQGDSRSGEVAVQASASGPTTTVLVRKLDDDTWWVLGASSPNLILQSPASSAAITSPVTLSGRSTAFEAVVNVEIRQDGSVTPLRKGVVMGGSNGQLGPFSKAFTFTKPAVTGGAVILETISAKDGTVAEATVVRVQFS